MAKYLTMTRNPKGLEDPKYPYFRISMPPEKEGGEWVEIASCWRARSGKPGVYSCKINDDIEIAVKSNGEVLSSEAPID